jgi:hypothetical protein
MTENEYNIDFFPGGFAYRLGDRPASRSETAPKSIVSDDDRTSKSLATVNSAAPQPGLPQVQTG